MNRYAVAYADFFSNDLIITIEEADTWMDAIRQRYLNDIKSKYRDDTHVDSANEWLEYAMGDNIEDVKQYFFDCDSLIDVIELKD